MSSEPAATGPPDDGETAVDTDTTVDTDATVETDSTADLDLDWLTLDGGEEILWASTPHKSSLIPAFAVGIPLAFVLIGIPILVGSYLTFTNTNYVVTSRGLYRKQGIFSRDVKQIGFDKVQNISYTQSAVGSRLGYGSVEISTAGSSGVELQFRNIPSPAAVQELISREIERREDGSRDQQATGDDILSEILTELRGIRQALDAASGEADTGAPSAIGADTGAQVDSGETGEGDTEETGEGDDPFEPAEPADPNSEP